MQLNVMKEKCVAKQVELVKNQNKELLEKVESQEGKN